MTDDVKENTIVEEKSEVKQEQEINLNPSETPTEHKSEAEDVLSILKANNFLLAEIQTVIQNRLEYDAVKEKAFDKLYEEMRRQKEASDLLDRAVKPVLSDLLLLHDSIKKFEASLVNQSIKGEEILQNIKYIVEELLEILYRQEVIPIAENSSEIFNSKIHKATKTENTEIMDDDFKIINIVRQGFTWRDKLLRPQDVVIKRFISKASS
ncbi:MAG: molecular chaperone GrpE [Euryarchaeota archaeon]|nr:molecular chaperone GrpE [Euryarchaeota archaeon]